VAGLTLVKTGKIMSKLVFLRTILTGKERNWLETSPHEVARRFRWLRFLLGVSTDVDGVEHMTSILLMDVMSNRRAYQK